MKRIYEIDKNFKVNTDNPFPDTVFYDARKAPFCVYGLIYEGGMFRRMPEEAARKVNEGVLFLHGNTAGGRLRFCTDSPYIVLNAVMSGIARMPHFPLTGIAGFDLYVDGVYTHTFVPPEDVKTGYESAVELKTGGLHEILIHFPLYANVEQLAVGLARGAEVKAAAPYRTQKPVVFYGSSITQGGCASRPGNAYDNILSRRLCLDHINLGFSGSAKAEDAMIGYLCALDMAALVLDYDHNAPDAAHLGRTHEKLFLAVRKAKPDLPVLMLARPQFRLRGDEAQRLAVIRATYEHALERGDRLVRLLDGPQLMRFAGCEGTVDGCHPNDLGFYSMAQAVAPILRDLPGF